MARDPLTALLPRLNTGGRRIALPARLTGVTTIDRDRECDPAEVGLRPEDIDRIWDSVRSYYRSGLHPAITLVVRRHGKVVMSRGIGHAKVGAEGEAADTLPALASADTPMCLFSGSKAISAMLIHKLAEEGKLALNDRVTRFLPEYGTHGKHLTTLRDLLTHKAGIRIMPVANAAPELMFDFDTVVKLLAASPPLARPGDEQAYHAVTAGYILGAVAQKASGESQPALLKRIIADPLGCTHMTYGVPEDRRHEVALSHSTGPSKVFLASQMLQHMLGVPDHVITEAINSPAGLSAIVPAANIYASAEEACRFYQMLLDGGRWNGTQVFKPETVAAATRRGPLLLDRSARAPMRYSPAFMVGEKLWSLYGFNTPQAFGHLGFVNILCWADPARALSVAFMNTGKTLAPEGFLGFANVTRTISQSCPPV